MSYADVQKRRAEVEEVEVEAESPQSLLGSVEEAEESELHNHLGC